MSVQHSRTAEPLRPEEITARGIAWWGMLIGVIALATFLGGLLSSYLYLRSGAPTWPPSGVEPPSVLLGLAAVALVVVAAVLAGLSHRRTRDGRPEAMRGLLAVGGLVAVGAIAVRAVDLNALQIGWDEHVYASLIWLVRGFELTILGAGVIMSATMIAQSVAGHIDVARHQHVAVVALYWWFVAAATVAIFITVDLVAYL